MKPFSISAAEAILAACAGHTIMHTDSGPGIILRHDVDSDLERSLQFARLETHYGIQSCFYILNTARYWKKPGLFDTLRDIQAMGHEIGWHNNALAEWVKTGKKTDLKLLVQRPLDELRQNGLAISGTAAHGDGLCHKLGFLNYQIWHEWCKDNPNFPGIDHPKYSLKDFGLNYESYLIECDSYISDSGGKWFANILHTVHETIQNQQRLIILIHPEWWFWGPVRRCAADAKRQVRKVVYTLAKMHKRDGSRF